MPDPGEGKRRRVPYWLSFSLITLVLGGLTAAFVLVVLPQRFVLQAGLRESGISFPARLPSFGPVEGVAVPPRPLPTPPPPGVAEAFWAEVTPLLRDGRHREALPLFADYLVERPEDADVWREYGIALSRAGRGGEAEAALTRAAELSGDRRARLELARRLRERGATDRALALYRGLVTERPTDLVLRHEFARALAWSERYEEAAEEYNALVAEAPGSAVYRMEFGRTLYWAGRAGEAARILADLPEGSPEWSETTELRARLAAQLAAEEGPPEPAVQTAREGDGVPRTAADSAEDRLRRAREALAAGELERAREEYRAAAEMRPEDAELWREWADVLQYRLEDMEGARAALLHLAEFVDLQPEERLRLARLHAWTGREDRALAEVTALLQEEPEQAEAWALRGDLQRWRGNRHEAARAYERALTLSPQVEGAGDGLAAVREETERAVASRERVGIGPELQLFRDSEGYRRLDLSGRWSALHPNGALVARTGYRRLEGFGLGGARQVEEGAFGEVELSRWWREGSLRAAVSGGAERMEPFGVEPTFGLSLETRSPSGFSLEAAYHHGAAYPLATTLESVVEAVRADELRVAANHDLGRGWSAGASGEAASLRGGGTDNWRLGGGVSLFRRITPAFRLGVSSQLLGYADAAPVPATRRLYWDPRSYWATVAILELSLPERNGWSAYGGLRPGIAVVEERAPGEPGTVPQLSTEAGLRYRSDRFSLSTDAFYLRGREGDYNAFGIGTTFSVRP